MANWDFVVPYDTRAAAWLLERQLPHPIVCQGNRLPTTGEVVSAWRHFDLSQSILIDGFDWDDATSVPNESFKIRGDLLVTLQVLVKLCERCGQLWLYPDTGEPAIVVNQSTDAARVVDLLTVAGKTNDSWHYFYNNMYSA